MVDIRCYAHAQLQGDNFKEGEKEYFNLISQFI